LSANDKLTENTRIAFEFLNEHANKLPELHAVDVRRDEISFQRWVAGSPVEGMAQVSEALGVPAVITAHSKHYGISVTVKRGGVDVNVWDHLSPAVAMKLFLRLGIDPDTKVVELDAETLATVVEPDGGAER
jgi:hypothetical protein